MHQKVANLSINTEAVYKEKTEVSSVTSIARGEISRSIEIE
jgi:hypothetical protein